MPPRRKITPGCKRVTLTLPNALLESLDGVVVHGNRSRFLSYCARLYLARRDGDDAGAGHWERMLAGVLEE